MTTTLSAQSAASMTEADPAFSVPTRPRLLPGLVVVPLGDGVLVEGAETRQLFRGAGATGFLPELLSAMSATSMTVAEHARRLKVDQTRIAAAVALLYASGLLDDSSASPTPGLEDPTSLWVARHMDNSRLHPTRESVWRALHTTTVRVVGDSRLAAALVDHGLQVVDADADLTVVVGNGHDDVDVLKAVESDALTRGRDWLRVLFRGQAVELGPVGGPEGDRCVECLQDCGLLRMPHHADGPDTLQHALGVALASAEIVHLVSGSGRSLSTTGIMVFDTSRWSHTMRVTPRVPGCPSCAPDVGPGHCGAELTVAHAFDAAVRFPAVRQQRPKDHQQHYAARNLSLQRGFNPQRLAVQPLPYPASAQRGVLTTETLGVLLHRAFGVQSIVGGEARRCAPTGGNIGSPRAFVIAAGVRGLVPGRYIYEAAEHHLAHLGGLDGSSPDVATLVLTGDVARTSSKYVEFGTRVIHLDAGVAVAQLRLAAVAQGLRVVPQTHWDDDTLAAHLDIDLERTPITTVVTIQPNQGTHHD